MAQAPRNAFLGRKRQRGMTAPVIAGPRLYTDSPISMRRYPFDFPPSAPPERIRDDSIEVSPGWTQEDQNAEDEDARRAATRELVQSWQDRLQLITVVTTFFAAVEATLLDISIPQCGEETDSISAHAGRTANSAFVGALVVHVFAAIVAFVASFFLVGYKVKEAKIEEHKIEEGNPDGETSKSSSTGPNIWSTNPRLEQVGPFRSDKPPTQLLERCHSLCVLFGAVGFLLAILGIMCLSWARLDGAPKVFATICTGLCSIASITIVFYPA